MTSLQEYIPAISDSPKSNSVAHHTIMVNPLSLQHQPLSMNDDNNNNNNHPDGFRHRMYSSSSNQQWQHLYVLPVLLLEFLAIALTRAVLPSLVLHKYGDNVYIVMGCADCIRGLLAFLACPLFGKLSDVIGRRVCLFVTVMGTCAPCCSLAFFPWQDTIQVGTDNLLLSTKDLNSTSMEAMDKEGELWSMIADSTSTSSAHATQEAVHPNAIPIFVVLLALSGVFSSTFTLVFAYISDSVTRQDERVSAYGLALATFGLSFTIGPMAGGYLARYNKQYVFMASLILTIVDLLYIYIVLPESRQIDEQPNNNSNNNNTNNTARSSVSIRNLGEHNFSWNPWDAIRLIVTDPFLRKVGEVAFFYYTGVWALISTFSVYAVKRFHLSPERLGELISALGLCTMLAEAVLVRVIVPILGEKRAMKVGLVAFGLQCVVLGFASRGWHLFACVVFSLLGNLVYPSLSSLVSGSVEPRAVGEALGAINGIKALTEGIGPLVFGTLMTVSEKSVLPGWPYLLASVLIAASYKAADKLPDHDDYIHELDTKRWQQSEQGISIGMFAKSNNNQDDDEDEYESLLSEKSEEEEVFFYII